MVSKAWSQQGQTIKAHQQPSWNFCYYLFLFVCVASLDNKNAVLGSSCAPWHGCSLLLPKDIIYDSQVRQALNDLRGNNKEGTTTSTADAPNDGDDEKKKALFDGCSDKNHATLTLRGYKGGKVEDQINQDRAFIIPTFMVQDEREKTKEEEKETQENRNYVNNQRQLLLLGVFDGHGRKGEIVSQYSLDETPKRLSSKLQNILFRKNDNNNNESNDNNVTTEEDAIINALKETFMEVDRDIPTAGVGGCTASVMLHVGSKLYIANAGDSISLVAIRSSSRSRSSGEGDDVKNEKDEGEMNVVYVTREDKPHLADERARIESMGGKVYIPEDLERESSRVLFIDPKTGHQQGLAMSRSIGDWDMTGAIAEPLVDVIDLNDIIPSSSSPSCGNADGSNNNKDDEEKVCNASSNDDDGAIHEIFCISATDGLMDYITPELLAKTFASSFLLDPDQDTTHNPLLAAESLVIHAARGWESEMAGRYRDDIAIAAARIEYSKRNSNQ